MAGYVRSVTSAPPQFPHQQRDARSVGGVSAAVGEADLPTAIDHKVPAKAVYVLPCGW